MSSQETAKGHRNDLDGTSSVLHVLNEEGLDGHLPGVSLEGVGVVGLVVVHPCTRQHHDLSVPPHALHDHSSLLQKPLHHAAQADR